MNKKIAEQQKQRARIYATGVGTVILECWDETAREYFGGRVRREFWVPLGTPERPGGYVYEVVDDRPGTLGQQVCDRLCGGGSTISSTRERLLGRIRREYRSMRRMEVISREHSGYTHG